MAKAQLFSIMKLLDPGQPKPDPKAFINPTLPKSAAETIIQGWLQQSQSLGINNMWMSNPFASYESLLKRPSLEHTSRASNEQTANGRPHDN